MELCELGKVVKWMVTWASMTYDAESGTTTPKSFRVMASGFVTSIPNAEVNAGAENTGDVLISISKTNITDGRVEYEIDRGKGIFKVKGRDLIGKISSLY